MAMVEARMMARSRVMTEGTVSWTADATGTVTADTLGMTTTETVSTTVRS